MPELPDITIYLERLAPLIQGEPLERVLIHNPFVLRSVEPPLSEVDERVVIALERIGKRIVIVFGGDLFIVIHLMIAGRLRWRPPGKKLAGKMTMASFVFTSGTLYLTEAGTQRRASLHLVSGRAALRQFDRGGLEVMSASSTHIDRSGRRATRRRLQRPAGVDRASAARCRRWIP